eukprot:TRINITY_DN11538_c0_g1_i1.p1 TRINITY_DN11538_c0_g1~~TRINITY_DN11538_c0_g1_i1.p1  ORF type:complete len:132 (+),score=52.23 TRINITY_DN11538_c0_g1_i1:73-468(+)
MVLPPWWTLAGVKPEGPEVDMGTWKAISFTEEQQAKFFVNSKGEVQDQAKHDAAIAEHKKGGAAPAMVGGKGGLPPWWILAGVKPEGPEVDHGSWKGISFSEAQQATFACSASGDVTDAEKHKAAVAAHKK